MSWKVYCMKWNKLGRVVLATVVSLAMALGMSACGSYTVGFMWVLGTQYNQIAGFKIDDFTGNLTQIVRSPFASGGGAPVSIVVRPGGRYVYVLNQNSTAGADVALFSVGGDGVLSYQFSYTSSGTNPQWMVMDSTGSFLYVLDQVSARTATLPAASQVGSITVFAIDGATGRLSLVLNNQALTNGVPQTYFEVGNKPTMLFNASGCMYALDTGDQSIYALGVGGSGQLTVNVNSTTATGGSNITSINGNASHIYVTDAGANTIIPYTPGTSCALSLQVGGAVANLAQTANPVNTLVDNSGKFLYVINKSGTLSNVANSTISAFTIDPSTGRLQGIADVQNPYSVDSGPTCVVEDPSHQYLYTSNYNGTVTGKLLNQNTGQLSALTRGSTFQATGQGTCLAVSGNTD
jgi:6-phosphogluconolactonase (cycloisomerase 2 family)